VSISGAFPDLIISSSTLVFSRPGFLRRIQPPSHTAQPTPAKSQGGDQRSRNFNCTHTLYTAPSPARSREQQQATALVAVEPLARGDPARGVCADCCGVAGGAIGVGAAFPFDTLKTKAQTLDGGGGDARQAQGMLAIAARVIQTEGVSGFYGGVSTMMVGQAFIKALAFSCNDWVLRAQGASASTHTLQELCLAALISGFVTSFLVNPFERVKILCQAEAAGTYKNGLVCAQEIIATDGFVGFMTRGLGPTLLRETPSYGLYFVLYSLLMESPIDVLGVFAPLLAGALAGCGAWIPVYPIDVVKTQIQNTAGEERAPSAMRAAQDLYARGGVAIFWDGLESKMLRAATNHAVTFFVFDACTQWLSS